MNIKHIAEADFRSSEVTIFESFSRKNRDVVASLRKDDVVVFVSKSGNQLLFVHGFTEFQAANDTKRAITSVRHRIMGGSWNPLRLRNYLEEAGLSVSGLPRFEDYYKHLIDSSHAVTRRAA